MLNARLAAAFLVVVGCTAPTSITLRDGESGLVDLRAGAYRVTWTAECDSFFLEVAPTDGRTAIEIPASLPSGSATVQLPGGQAYVNRGGSCAGDYVVTLEPVG